MCFCLVERRLANLSAQSRAPEKSEPVVRSPEWSVLFTSSLLNPVKKREGKEILPGTF